MAYQILVVENDIDARSDCHRNLRQWGYEVIMAEGKGEALIADARTKACQPDCNLVLLDMRLLDDDDPDDESGLQLAKELAPIPCVVATNHGTMDKMRDAWQDGRVLDFVNKAKGPRTLKAALENATAKIRQRQLVSLGKARALLVGVNHYENPYIKDLTVCVGDATEIHALLSKNYEMVRLLTDVTTEQLPMRANIFDELDSVVRATEQSDLLLFYFSGHGIAMDGESYLLPCDARFRTLRQTSVSMRDIRKIMNQSPAQARVIVLDACYSGATTGKAGPQMTEEFIRHVFVEAEGIVVLASCKQEEQSWEWQEHGRSVFTYYLLEALSGKADFDNKGFVTVSDVNRYVSDKVRRWAAEHGVPQTPTMQSSVAGDIVLVRYM